MHLIIFVFAISFFSKKQVQMAKILICNEKKRRDFHCKYFKSTSALTHWCKSVITDEKFGICTYRHLKKGKCH